MLLLHLRMAAVRVGRRRRRRRGGHRHHRRLHGGHLLRMEHLHGTNNTHTHSSINETATHASTSPRTNYRQRQREVGTAELAADLGARHLEHTVQIVGRLPVGVHQRVQQLRVVVGRVVSGKRTGGLLRAARMLVFRFASIAIGFYRVLSFIIDYYRLLLSNKTHHLLEIR